MFRYLSMASYGVLSQLIGLPHGTTLNALGSILASGTQGLKALMPLPKIGYWVAIKDERFYVTPFFEKGTTFLQVALKLGVHR